MLDSRIWRNLPPELIMKIVHESSPSIDVQLAFKIPPKKIEEDRAWRLWYLLKSHDGVIYNLETKSLHILRLIGFHMVRRPIELDQYDDGLWIFNSQNNPHSCEVSCPSGSLCFLPECTDTWVTEMRVLLKGSGISRAISSVTDRSHY